MSQFGDIQFVECKEVYGEGMYEGRKFIVLPEEVDGQGNAAHGIVEGHFTDDERLFIWTQWEMRLNQLSLNERVYLVGDKVGTVLSCYTAPESGGDCV